MNKNVFVIVIAFEFTNKQINLKVLSEKNKIDAQLPMYKPIFNFYIKPFDFTSHSSV